MTKPMKIQAKKQHQPATKTGAAPRQSQPEKSSNSVKKAPAPPPNPALVNPQNSPPPQVNPTPMSQHPQADRSSADQPSRTNQGFQKAYDRHTDGALTYFNYYFEDLTTPTTPADYPTSPVRSKIPLGAVGAGVVAATLASGAIISDAMNQPEAPQSRQPQDATVKQNADSQRSRPTTTAPEKLETGRSLSLSPTRSKPTTTPTNRQPAPASKRTQSTANSLISSGPLVSNAQPLKLAPLSLPSAPRSAPSSPAVSDQAGNVKADSNLRKAAIRAAIARQLANPAAVAPPETLPPAEALPGTTGTTLPANPGSSSLPTGNAPSQPTNPSSQVPSQPANSQTTPLPPGAGMPTSTLPSSPNPVSSPDTTVSSQPETAASNTVEQTSGKTTLGSNSTTTASNAPDRQAISVLTGNAPGDRLLETSTVALNRVTPAPTSSSPAPTSTPTSPLASHSAEGIQDYLNRPAKPATATPSLLPLSSKAAGEAASKPQIGVFTVRQVSQQDYQKEWQASNRNISDPAIAYAFPAYGFIDYQRQVIVVLKEQPDLNPLQSQRSTPPNS